MRTKSPSSRQIAAFQPPPELLTDYSNSASDEDQAMDQDMDQDQDMDNDALNGSANRFRDSPYNEELGFRFGHQGSGGFGFGPGAEEDCGMDAEDEREDGMSKFYL